MRAAFSGAANRGCQGGGGVDGAITRAGGDELRKLRHRLPKPFPGVDDRCETGDAVRTTAAEGANLGRLNVKTVIHAVGPDYGEKGMSHAESDGLLRLAYGAAIREANAAKVESVAFPLISAKIFRGNRDLAGLLELSLDALVTAADASSLKEARVLVAFSSRSPTLSSRRRGAPRPAEAAARRSASRARRRPKNEGRRRRPHERHLGGVFDVARAGLARPDGRPGAARPDRRGRRRGGQAQGARRARRLARPHDR